MSRTPPAVALAALMVLTACSGDSGDATTAAATPRPATSSAPTSSDPASGSPEASPSQSPGAPPAPAAPPEAPWGPGPLLPKHILVGFAGHEHARALGILGLGRLGTKGRELRAVAKPYAAKGRTPVPVFEFLATLVHGSAGDDGMYRGRAKDAQVRKYLKAARKAGAVLLLGIQPGRADFLPEVKAYEKFLKEPDVGIALDPEWAVDADKLPGKHYGRTTGAELDGVAKYLARLVEQNDLPEKVMVYHQLSLQIVEDEERLRPHEGVVLVKSIDGIGSPGAKVDTFRAIVRETPKHVEVGFKLFYEEDRKRGGRLMRPSEVLALRPRPVYVVFE